MSSIRFRFLGSPSVEVDGEVTSRFRWSKLPAIFAYLVLFPGDQSRESIADALWPDRPAENARQNLRQTLVYADQLLGPAADQVLRVSRQTIALRKGAVTSDIDAFLRLPSPTLDRGGRTRCQLLVDSYAGPFLPNLNDEWVVTARVQIARSYQEALVFLARDLLDTDPVRSLSLAESAIQEDPFDDPARAVKIEALLALRREAAAKQEFAAYAEMLSRELGMQPGRIVAEALREKDPNAKAERKPEPVDARTEAIAEAVQLLRDQGMYKEAADLALALVPVWIGMGTPAFGQRVLVTAFSEMDRPVGVFEKLSLAKLAYAEGDLVRARELCQEILRIGGPDEVRAESLFLMARIELLEVKPVTSLGYSLASLRLLRKLGNRELQYEAWLRVVMARFSIGQFDRVPQPSIRAEKLAERCLKPASRREVRIYRAFAALRQGRLSEAEAIAEDIRQEWIATPVENRYSDTATLARIFDEMGKREIAVEMYQEALTEWSKRGNMFGANVALTYLGDMMLELGDPDASLKYHFEALKSRRELKQNLGIATNLRGIGRALLKKGHANEARLSLQESTQRFRDDNALSGYASSQLLLAQAEWEAGDRSLAHRLAQNSVEILRGMNLAGRLTIGPWGEHILEDGEDLLKQMQA